MTTVSIGLVVWAVGFVALAWCADRYGLWVIPALMIAVALAGAI